MSYIEDKKLRGLYVQLMNLSDSLIEKSRLTPRFAEKNLIKYEDLLVVLFMKSYKTMKGVYLLSKEGYGPEALVVFRSILETVIDVKYMRQEKSDRSALYLGYFFIDKYKIFKNMKNSKMFSGEDPKILESQYQKIIEQYKKEIKRRGNIKSSSWSGIPKEQMASEVGLQEIYDYVYRLTSGYVHSSSGSLDATILGIDETEKNVIMVRGPHVMSVGPALSIAMSTFIEILKIASQDLSITLDEDILAYERKFKKDTNGRVLEL